MSGPESTGQPYDLFEQDRLQKVTARRLRAAVAEKPQVTLHARVGLDVLFESKRRLNAESADAVSVTVTAALAHIVAAALTRWGRVNGHIEGNEVRLFRAVNLGVAVDTGHGLVVPVVKDAQGLSVWETAAEIGRLAENARQGKLHPADLVDATFTVSNLGMFGVEMFTPLVNPPQLAILGVGAAVPAVTLIDGRVAEMQVLGLSLSFDHAAMDGADAAAFLAGLVTLIEEPQDVLWTTASEWKGRA